jgi:hypothetical protein
MKKTIITISHCELNTIVDALRYAAEQTKDSNGDIQAFCTDSNTMEADDNMAMAVVADSLAEQLAEVFKEGSVDFIIDVNDTSDEFTVDEVDIAALIAYNAHESRYSSYDYCYCPDHDMTFVLRCTYDAQTNDHIRDECVSWFYGKANEISFDDALNFGLTAYYE